MAFQKRCCWVSSEPTNNDHVYHTSASCGYLKNIKPENLIKIPLDEALQNYDPPYHDCEGARGA